LSAGLDVLCKYGLNLLTPVALRQNGWQRIIYGNQVFVKYVDSIQVCDIVTKHNILFITQISFK